MERVVDSGIPPATDHIPATTATAEDTAMRGKDTYIRIFWCLANRGAKAIVNAIRNSDKYVTIRGDKFICSCVRNYKNSKIPRKSGKHEKIFLYSWLPKRN